MRRKNISLSNDIGYLEDLDTNIKCLPSEKVFFDYVPYKVMFKKEKLNRREVRHFKQEVSYFKENNLNGRTRTNFSQNAQILYLSEFKDLQKTIAVFTDLIEYISGPINEDHLDIMLRDDYKCETKQTLYYNRYDTKIKAYPVLNNTRYHFNYLQLSSPEFINNRDDFFSFIRENISKDNYRFRYTNTKVFRFDESDFYMCSHDLIELLPFIKMQFPNIKLVVTRCMIK